MTAWKKSAFPTPIFCAYLCGSFALEITLCVLWIAVALFFTINFIVKLVREIAAVCRKNSLVDSIGSWDALASFAGVTSTVLLFILVVCNI